MAFKAGNSSVFRTGIPNVAYPALSLVHLPY